MKNSNDLIIDDSGKIIYKNIDTDITCENIFNLFSQNYNFDLIKFIKNEIREDLRESIIKDLFYKRA
jgi:hypothetical protein